MKIVLSWLKVSIVELRRRLLELVSSAKIITYFFLSVALSIILARVSQSASSDRAKSAAVVSNHVLSPIAIVALVLGGIISILFFRGMYRVLHNTSKIYELKFDPNAASDRSSSKANNILIFGSFLLVVGSAAIISSYGWGPIFLYLGPILCLLGPFVIIVSMEVDVKKSQKLQASLIKQDSELSVTQKY
ncbi:MAG: hypothetical protein JOZ78_21030 [Chroococcidiopsidaceae cyanobacterium CP_BM_ER_R8_30]|nr:hypothetical protein [Chroococcidiopsidaceae cyanobacterium CP_BM_ER_R8_30]